MSEQGDVFVAVLAALERLRIPYMIVGSLAAVRYGEPRLTLDMDIVIHLAPAQIDALAGAFSADYYADVESMRDAVQRRGHFNIINGASGAKVDFFVLKNDAYQRTAMQRRRREPFDTTLIASFAAPEDTILGKLLYYQEGGSEKHLRDVRGIVQVQGQSLDSSYVMQWAERLGVGKLWQDLFHKQD